jgi:formiminoglutamase
MKEVILDFHDIDDRSKLSQLVEKLTNVSHYFLILKSGKTPIIMAVVTIIPTVI